MTTTQTILASTIVLLFSACGQRPHKDKPNHPDWTTLKIPNGWNLQTPKTFKDSTLQGVDSNVGLIFYKADSLFLEYDCGTQMLHKADCDFDKEVENAKRSIGSNFYKEQYHVPTLHTVYIDTIGDRIAEIVIPTNTGNGTVSIELHDCASGAWLGITGRNLTADRQKLVLEIFKTIDHEYEYE